MIFVFVDKEKGSELNLVLIPQSAGLSKRKKRYKRFMENLEPNKTKLTKFVPSRTLSIDKKY